MATTSPSRTERTALCDLLDATGPDAPTLCEGWTTRDLAVHLVLREHDPVAAPGILLGGPWRTLLVRATRRLEAVPYPDLVARVRRGPPVVLAPLDPLVNVLELFVHHEDVRRGGGDTTPRPTDELVAVDDALWRTLGSAGWLLTRRLGPVGLQVRRPDGTARTLHRGSPTATLTGAPGELALFLTGRQAASHAVVGGPDDAARAVRTARFGL